MKHIRSKLIAAVAVLVLLTAVVLGPGLTASAHVDGGYLGDVPKTSETITVDGQKDDIYKYGLAIDIKYEKDLLVHATGVVTLLYSGGILYAFAEVTDDDMPEPDKTAQQESPWRTDSFEVFINIKNSNNVYDVMQYRIDSSGYPSVYNKDGLNAYGDKAAKEYFSYAETDTSTGYCCEFAIPVDAAGKDIGVNFQINDIYGPDNTLTWAVVYSEAVQGGTDSWSVNIYPYLSLGSYTTASLSGVVTEPTVPPASPTDEAPDASEPADTATDGSNSGNNSGSNDSSGPRVGTIIAVCVSIAVLIAAVIIIVLRVRKKK